MRQAPEEGEDERNATGRSTAPRTSARSAGSESRDSRSVCEDTAQADIRLVLTDGFMPQEGVVVSVIDERAYAIHPSHEDGEKRFGSAPDEKPEMLNSKLKAHIQMSLVEKGAGHIASSKDEAWASSP